MNREDHGGSDGPGLEVVTVTPTDVPLGRGQSWGHICLKRRLGKVVTLSTQGRGNWVWWTSHLCPSMFLSMVSSRTSVPDLSTATFSQSLEQWGAQRVSPLQSSDFFHTLQNCKEGLEIVHSLHLPPPSPSFLLFLHFVFLRLNHLKSLIFDTLCPTKMAFSYGLINIILLAFSWENPRSACHQCIPSPQAEISLRIKPKEREKRCGRGWPSMLLPDVFGSALPQLRESSHFSPLPWTLIMTSDFWLCTKSFDIHYLNCFEQSTSQLMSYASYIIISSFGLAARKLGPAFYD